MLNLSIPIYSGGATRSRRRAAEYQVIAAQESLEFTKRQLTQNIRKTSGSGIYWSTAYEFCIFAESHTPKVIRPHLLVNRV